MRNLALFLSLVLFVSCNQESQQPTEIEDVTIDTNVVEVGEDTLVEELNRLPTEESQKDTGYSLTDTIHIDLNGNGIIDQVYFVEDSCKRLIVEENGNFLIEIGCGREDENGLPNAVGWIDHWYIVRDLEQSEFIAVDGDLLGDKEVILERPSIYVGKEEAGGGIITFLKGKPYWVHQSC